MTRGCTRTWFYLCLGSCLCVWACSVEGDPLDEDRGTGGTGRADAGPAAPPIVATPGATLSISGETRLRLVPGETVELTVRLTDDGVALGGLPVVFDLVGQTKDSALSQLAATTDSQGFATTTLHAGQRIAAFEARAKTPGAGEVSYDVAVSGAGFGTLNVLVQYEGERSVERRFARAYPEATCVDLNAKADDPAIALVPGAESARLIALPAGATYAVQAFAKGKGDAVIASGCLDGVMVIADAATDVMVALFDQTLAPAEALSIQLELRAITSASAIGSTLRAAAETLVQQTELGNVMYGTEGSFWLDALDGALRDANGDASQLALAEALAEARTAAPSDGPDAELSRLLNIHDEGVLVATDTLADDVRDPMRDLTLEGTLTIDMETGSAAVAFSRITCGPVVDDDQALAIDLSATTPNEASITPVMDVDALLLSGVRFEPRFGALAAKALRRILSNDVHGEALTELAGCGSLEAWLEDQSVVDASACDGACVEAACAVGMERLQQAGQDALLATDEARPIAELSMTLALRDADGDLVAEEMVSDTLTGEWKPAPDATLGDSLTGSASALAEP
jgi:hypothetical protein